MICYDLDSRSNVHSQGNREYLMKFFISSKCCMNECQQKNLKNKTTKQRHHQNIEYRTIAVS